MPRTCAVGPNLREAGTRKRQPNRTPPTTRHTVRGTRTIPFLLTQRTPWPPAVSVSGPCSSASHPSGPQASSYPVLRAASSDPGHPNPAPVSQAPSSACPQLRSACHPCATHPICGPPAQIRVPPIQPGAIPFPGQNPKPYCLGDNIYMYISISICISLSRHVCIYISVYLHIYASIHLYIYMPIYIYICTYIYLSIYIYISVSMSVSTSTY